VHDSILVYWGCAASGSNNRRRGTVESGRPALTLAAPMRGYGSRRRVRGSSLAADVPADAVANAAEEADDSASPDLDDASLRLLREQLSTDAISLTHKGLSALPTVLANHLGERGRRLRTLELEGNRLR
jgi:hypothetical protein